MEITAHFPKLSTDARNAFCGLGVLLLFLPKINLIQIGGETAGIRIDDLILAGILAFLVAVTLIGLRTSVSKLEMLFAALVAEAIVSNAINFAFYHRSSFLYSLRLVEYFLFFYVGYYFAGSLARVAKWVLLANALVMVLQEFGLVGAASSEGLASSIQYGRAVGLTGGPWEVGVVINFCCAILVFDQRRKPRPASAILVFAVGFALVLLTGSRMAAVAQIILVLIYLYLRSRSGIRFITISLLVLSVVVAGLVLVPNPLTKRSANLFTLDNFEALRILYDSTPDDPGASGLADFRLADSTGDLSWVIRAAKWSGAVKLWNRSILTMIFGVGPGTLGPALDGSWLRVLTETGVVGLLAFLLFSRYIFRNLGWQMRGVLLSLQISMLMVDIHIAYKAMSFFMFSLGFLYKDSLDERPPLIDVR